jgi:hypothetical protein
MNSSSHSTVPVRSGWLRWLRRLFFAGVALVTLLVLAVAWLNWTGEREWKQVRSRLIEQGEPVSLKDMLPPLPPPERNLAMIPLLSPMLDYRTLPNGSIEWAEPDSRKRLLSGVLITSSKEQSTKPPRAAKWRSGELTDLVAWQDYYAANADFPRPAQPGTPGRDVLMALSRDASSLAQLREGLQRPECRFPVHFDDANSMTILLPHLAVLKRITTYLQLSSLAHLSEKHPVEAWNNLEIGFRLMQGIEQEPILISYLVRNAMLQLIAQTIWEGAAYRQWDAVTLDRLQKAMESVDILGHQLRSLQGERTSMNGMYERWVTSPRSLQQDSSMMSDGGPQGNPISGPITLLFPRGLLRKNQAAHNLYLLEMIQRLKAVRKPGGEYEPIQMETLSGVLRSYLEPKSIFNSLVRLLAPAIEGTTLKGLDAQATRDVVVVAMALERYHLAKGQYPESLAPLVPEWIQVLPEDIFTGEPLRYQRSANGSFVLYSVGQNAADDGGEWPPSSKTDPNRGTSDDIVWRYPKE